jgi:hypothetical protein
MRSRGNPFAPGELGRNSDVVCDLEARFNDIDINRDGVITREELARYIGLRYGVASAR